MSALSPSSKRAFCAPAPILMTTAAALLGALALALGTGIGSELRRPLGVTIIGAWLSASS